MRRLLSAALGLSLALAACGSPSADLFEVVRTGADPNANVRLLVSDGGSVRCNRGKPVPLDAERLLTARALAHDLEGQAALGLELPRGRGTILSYRARLEAGTIAFSDRSRGIPPSFNRLVAFTTDVAERVCKLER
ncbi:MAG: hypothetical protein ACXW08_15250 [Solirubrobacteraceae bacterium]